MNSASVKITILIIGLFVVLNGFGCAQVAHKVDVLYSPLASYRGGGGNLELVVTDTQRGSVTNPTARWAIGKIKDSDGNVTGEVISDMPPQDLIANAFKQELSSAGYLVNYSKGVDKFTGKGIVLSNISVQLDETPSLVKLESSCTIVLKMELWQSGVAVKRSEYRAKLSDIAVRDRDELSKSVYQKAIHEVIQQAVPDIIRQFK